MRVAVGAGLALSLLSAAAAAKPGSVTREASSGWQLSARTGFGLPLGRYADERRVDGTPDAVSKAVGDDTQGAIPIWLDLGYRVHERLVLGAYGMYGIALFKAAASDDPLAQRGGCPDGFDCTGSGWRFGVQGEYQFLPGATVQPWVSLGFGYELIEFRSEGTLLGTQVNSVGSYSGVELLHLQTGADIPISQRAALGAFVSASLARNLSCSDEFNGKSRDCEIEDAATHTWLLVGARARFTL